MGTQLLVVFMVRFLVGAVLSKGWGAATTLGFDPSCLILSPCATNSVIKGWMYDELSLGIAHKMIPPWKDRHKA